MSLSQFCRISSAALLMAAACSVSAAVPASRISVIDSSAVEVPGNVSPRLAAAKDLGAVRADQPIQRMSLRFAMTDAQQASLSQLLVNLQNPASAQYHQWLTPEQFAAQFGLSASDLAKVSGWLTAQGFTITSVARGGLFVEFSGTAGQADSAFGTELHRVQLDGEEHFANVTAPQLPKAIASVTAAVTGLDDFKMKPHLEVRTIAGSGLSAEGAANPNYTSSVNGSTYIAPGDFYTIYDEAAAISSGIKGTGITIAVVGQTDVYSADVANFRSVSGLAANPYTVALDGSDPGYGSASDVIESELDLEWAGATAPGASLIFVNSNDVVNGSLTYAVDNNLAPIITDSYRGCEANLGDASLVYYESLLQMAASEGITVVAAAGNSGATGCDTGSVASDGLVVDFPASSPYVLGVGGTEFNEGAGNYWSTTNGSYQGSALSYIPEIVWNDDALGGGLASGGGGASLYFSKPSWQVGTGVPADFSRDVPDVALSASAKHDPYLVCTQGYCTNGYRDVNGNLSAVGGTSVVAPSFAGLLALVEQKIGSRIGVANPQIYALANSSYASTVFHDITVGNNESPCTTGTLNCPNGGNIGYVATTGYDRATGWGSVDVFRMINDWALVLPLATTGGQVSSYTTVAGSTSSAVQGNSVTLTATVSSASNSFTTTPTGSVQFTVDSVAVGSAVALSGTTATYSLGTTTLSVGTHIVQATYLGDANYAGSKGAFSLNVTSATAPDFTLSPATTVISAAPGGVSTGATFTVAALNGFTGNVAFLAGYSSSLAVQSSFSVTPVVLSSTTTSGSTVFTLLAYAKTGGRITGLSKDSVVQERSSFPMKIASALTLAGFALLLVPRRRKLGGLAMVLVASALVSLSGCANGPAAAPATTKANTPTGTYPITIIATGTVNGTTVSHSATVTFIVQ